MRDYFPVAARLAVAACFSLSLAGCGEQGPQLPKCYPVSGTVLIDGEPFSAGDGVPAGDYVVTIVANWISRDGQDVGVPDLLGGQYANPEKSPLKVTVEQLPVTLEPYELTAK
jgi:hypothetical protein